MIITTLLLSLCLTTEPVKAPPPTIAPDEQITLLKLQLDEVVSELGAANAKIRRIDGVNKLLQEWNKRGCVVESDPQTGLLKCKALEVKKDK